MTGLDKIIQHIEEEAQSSADAVREEAGKKSEDILKEAEAVCEEMKKEAEAAQKQAVEDIRKKGRSAAEMKSRQEILAAKQQLIAGVLEQAGRKLENLDDKAYFDLMVKMAGTYAQKGAGQVIFSAKDRKRLPADLEQRMNEAAAAVGGSLKIASETRKISNGFLLVYGDIEENCTFDSIISSRREYLQDQIHTLLFS